MTATISASRSPSTWAHTWRMTVTEAQVEMLMKIEAKTWSSNVSSAVICPRRNQLVVEERDEEEGRTTVAAQVLPVWTRTSSLALSAATMDRIAWSSAWTMVPTLAPPARQADLMVTTWAAQEPTAAVRAALISATMSTLTADGSASKRGQVGEGD